MKPPDNPYQSTNASEQNNAPFLRLFTLNQIAVAALFSGPLSGIALAVLNLRRLGKIQMMTTMLALDALITGAYMLLIHQQVQVNILFLGLGSSLGIRWVAAKCLNPEYDQHRREFGLWEHWGKVFLISLGGLLGWTLCLALMFKLFR